MDIGRRFFAPLMLFLAIALPSIATAVPINVLVGDKDGFGIGCSDNGTCIWPGPGSSGSNFDGRDAAEQAATNGAQITDVYSALEPSAGPNNFTAADVLLPFTGTLTSATLTIAMGDFQSTPFGALSASINGFNLPFFFDDGFHVTKTRDFVLSPAELAAANTAGQVDLHLDRNNSVDFVAFDWFQLAGNAPTSVPEPASLALLGIGLAGLAAARRRKQMESSQR